VASGNEGSPEFDFESWQQRYQERAAEQEREGRALIARLCGALRRLGVEQIEIAYEGTGDSGAIEQFEVVPDIEPGIPDAYRTVLEHAVYGLLPGGWEINEGSAGTVTIDVDSGEVEVDHTWRPAEDQGVIDDEDD
jgi:hypothetical protein